MHLSTSVDPVKALQSHCVILHYQGVGAGKCLPSGFSNVQLPLRALSAASRSLRLCGAGELPAAAARAAAMFGSSCSGWVGRSNLALAVAASAEARSLLAASCIAISATVMLLVALLRPPAR